MKAANIQTAINRVPTSILHRTVDTPHPLEQDSNVHAMLLARLNINAATTALTTVDIPYKSRPSAQYSEV